MELRAWLISREGLTVTFIFETVLVVISTAIPSAEYVSNDLRRLTEINIESSYTMKKERESNVIIECKLYYIDIR